jgi:hypothetical protein
VEEQAKPYWVVAVRLGLACRCREPEIIAAIAHRYPFAAIKPDAELGWQPGKPLVLSNGVIECHDEGARID